MCLVDNQIVHRDLRTVNTAPVKSGLGDTRTVIKAAQRTGSPVRLTGNRTGIRIEQQILPIKQQTLFRIVWTVHPVCIFEIFNIQTEYNH